MPKRSSPESKSQSLRAQGCLNPTPEKIRDALFQGGGFFDPRDMVQVKYEMLRRAEAEGHSISDTAAAFGVSRPSFYHARRAVAHEGLPGLVPKKRGPRGGHKLTEDIVAFLTDARDRDDSLGGPQLAELVQRRFAVTVHPRTVERALRHRGKKNRP